MLSRGVSPSTPADGRNRPRNGSPALFAKGGRPGLTSIGHSLCQSGGGSFANHGWAFICKRSLLTRPRPKTLNRRNPPLREALPASGHRPAARRRHSLRARNKQQNATAVARLAAVGVVHSRRGFNSTRGFQQVPRGGPRAVNSRLFTRRGSRPCRNSMHYRRADRSDRLHIRLCQESNPGRRAAPVGPVARPSIRRTAPV